MNDIEMLRRFHGEGGAPIVLKKWIRNRQASTTWQIRRHFYRTIVIFRSRFGNWPSKDLWETLLRKASEARKLEIECDAKQNFNEAGVKWVEL